MITFQSYKEQADSTAVYPNRGSLMGVVYCALGAAGEAGELANKVKKVLRGDAGLTEEVRAAILDEVGDTLWYMNEIAIELGSSLEAVAERNLQKLEDRVKRNVLKGSGDNR